LIAIVLKSAPINFPEHCYYNTVYFISKRIVSTFAQEYPVIIDPMKKKIRKEILSLALPLMLSNLLDQAVVIVDIFLVGGVGASAIAAVGLAQLLFMTVLTLLYGLSMGTLVVVSQLRGAGREEEAARTGYQSLVVGAVIAFFIGLVGGAFGQKAAVLLGAEEEVARLTGQYVRLLSLFFPFSVSVIILTGILQGWGDTRTPMKAGFLVNILHVIFAYPLIYGKLGLPGLGVAGAALAVGLSELIEAGFLMFHVFKARRLVPKPFDLGLTKRVIRVGIPVFGQRIFQQIGQMAYARAVLVYGTVAYAAHQVGLAIEALSYLQGGAFSIAAASTVGASVGARKYKAARLKNWEANRIAVLIMAGMGLVFFFFPYLLLRIFTQDPEVIRLGTFFLKIVAVMQVPLAITMVLEGSLKGAGDTRFLLLVTIAGMWMVRVPLSSLFSFSLGLPLVFVWGVMVVDWFTRMTILLMRYRSERWQRAGVIR
jgi:putative MATE family efflux protein